MIGPLWARARRGGFVFSPIAHKLRPDST